MMFRFMLAAILALPVYKEDDRATPEKIAQQHAIAAAVYEFGRTPEERAFLIAWGQAESGFSLRVQRGDCRVWECDRDSKGVAMARGPWQAHRNGMRDEDWARMVGVENTRFQAERAAMHTRWALRSCKGDVRCAFRLLGGLKPTQELKGENERMATYELIRGRL
jgi:hypothetical protein